MQLIEGQMCVFFLIKRRQIRSNKIRIESARVRGSNKDINLRVSKQITSTFGSKNRGNNQRMQVTIVTCSLKITCSGEGSVSVLAYFRAISAHVIY